MTREFTPAGLPDYRVRQADGYWWVVRVSDGWTIHRRATAKAAVAAAHAEARFRADLAAGIKPEWMIRAEDIVSRHGG